MYLFVLHAGSSECGLLDIIHEDLIRSWKTLRGWVEEYQEALPIERKIEADAAEWKRDGKREDLLLRAGQLTKAEEYVTKYGDMGLLNGVGSEFIEVSRELRKSLERKEEERKKREFEQEQKARKLAQRRNQILGIFSFFMIGVSAWALLEQQIAQHNSKVSLALRMAEETELVIANGDLYDLGTLLGLESKYKVQELQESQQVWWQKVIKKSLGDKFQDIPQDEANIAIRRGLTKLPDHLHTLLHQAPVGAVAFSPDSQTIATASYDHTARLWDRETGKQLAILKHQDTVWAVAFSPDGQTIATGSHDKTARLWDRETGKELTTLLH